MNHKKSLRTDILTLWTRPNSYMGPDYYDYYTLPQDCGITRDSDTLARSNYRVALEMLGGESDASETDNPAVMVIRDSHWAVGWIEYILVHKDATDKVAILIDIVSALDSYPVLDDSDFSQEECNEADETFDNNSREFVKEILEYLEFKDPTITISKTKLKELELLASEIYQEDIGYCGIENAWVSESSIKNFMRNEYVQKDIKSNRFYKLLKLKG